MFNPIKTYYFAGTCPQNADQPAPRGQGGGKGDVGRPFDLAYGLCCTAFEIVLTPTWPPFTTDAGGRSGTEGAKQIARAGRSAGWAGQAGARAGGPGHPETLGLLCPGPAG